ncbi:YTH domain-containing protein [Dioscorea alata]|nr:YTH domain-containing protein [Dioscorea alata]
MEMYNGSDRLVTETYMMPGTGLNPQLASTPPLEDIDYMGNETAPEVLLDQGLYYPSAANYYGYYCTGFESPSELDDHHMFFGIDGQDLQSGLQTDGAPYVYYSPSYEYAQSPYNPYNPYIPGAVGYDSQFIGTQQYATGSLYQQPISSPAYFPVVVQSNSDIAPNSYSGHLTSSNGSTVMNRVDSAPLKHTPRAASASADSNLQKFGSGYPTSLPFESPSHPTQSLSKLAEGLLSNKTHSKQSSSHGAITSGRNHQVPQAGSSGSIQTTHRISNDRAPSVNDPFKGSLLSGNGIGSFGSNSHVWDAPDKFGPGIQFNSAITNGDRSSRMLYDQSRAPRANRSKVQQPSMITVKAYRNKVGAGDAHGNIVIQTDKYNRDDFALDYSEAKFFVIKSYSEDDVHKSIKYNVWSSTPNGNKKLDSAYNEAQRISAGKPRHCPVFLFFSVNASGHFCGVAEMVGPVDFSKDMEFWQQDKWIGSFPIKWHIIKDVPNTSLRHIILENNENRPVTSSRDTQEVPYLPGLSMLHIFKNSSPGTSVLDDFMFYEERQKIMEEERSRLPRRGYSKPFALASSVQSYRPSDSAYLGGPSLSQNQLNVAVNEPLHMDEDQSHVAVGNETQNNAEQQNGIAHLPEKFGKLDLTAVKTSKEAATQSGLFVKEEKAVLNGPAKQLYEADGKEPILLTKNSPITIEKSTDLGGPKKAVSPECHPVADKEDTSPEIAHTNDVESVFQIGSITIYPKGGKTNSSLLGPRESYSEDVVTVGSMRIKVNKDGQSSLIEKS